MVVWSLNAIVSIGVAEMCSCTFCSTYCTRFCSYSAFSIATEMCAVGTARGAAAHFHDTNRDYGIQRSSHQSFKSILCRIWNLQHFEVGISFFCVFLLKNCTFRRICEILVDFGLKKSEILQALPFQWCFRLRRRFKWYVARIKNTTELFPTSDADPPIFRSESTGFQQNFMVCTPQGRFLVDFGLKKSNILQLFRFRWWSRLRTRFLWHIAWI